MVRRLLLYEPVVLPQYTDVWVHRFSVSGGGIGGCPGTGGGWIAGCGWVPRRVTYEGHVPHTGRARTQEVAKASKLLSTLMMFETHQPLKF